MNERAGDDDDLLELPPGSLADGEHLGVDDADELTLAEIEDGPEAVGLDTETIDSSEFGADLEDGLDDDVRDPLDDTLLEFEAEVEAELDEAERWIEGSESATGGFDEDLGEDELLAERDDGGLDGVDDPMLDALENDGELPLLDGEEAEIEDNSAIDELIREIAHEG